MPRLTSFVTHFDAEVGLKHRRWQPAGVSSDRMSRMGFIISFLLFVVGLFLFGVAFNAAAFQAAIFFAGILLVCLSFGIPAHILSKR